MKTVILNLVAAGLMLSATAKAEVDIDQKNIDAALNAAMIKADIKIWCGSDGQEFANEMAASLRQAALAIPSNGKNEARAENRIERVARSYEDRCEKSIREALSNGVTEEEISQLLQQNAN